MKRNTEHHFNLQSKTDINENKNVKMKRHCNNGIFISVITNKNMVDTLLKFAILTKVVLFETI